MGLAATDSVVGVYAAFGFALKLDASLAMVIDEVVGELLPAHQKRRTLVAADLHLGERLADVLDPIYLAFTRLGAEHARHSMASQFQPARILHRS